MKNQILYLPPTNCHYYFNGHCMYEENLNPGFNTQWRCRTLQAMEQEYDDFLHRAEVFQLPPEKATRLWAEKASRVEFHFEQCPDFNPGVADMCTFLHMDICTLMLPKCEEKCGHFLLSPRTSKDGIEN